MAIAPYQRCVSCQAPATQLFTSFTFASAVNVPECDRCAADLVEGYKAGFAQPIVSDWHPCSNPLCGPNPSHEDRTCSVWD